MKKVFGWILYIAIIGVIMGAIVQSTSFIFDVVYGGKISSLLGSFFLYVIDIVLIITILLAGYVAMNFVNSKFLEKT